MPLQGIPDGEFVIFDNHMHLSPTGRLLEAVDMFTSAGGDSFNLVNLPDKDLATDGYYGELYRRTLNIASLLKKERNLDVPVTLGPYPLDYFRFLEKGLDPVNEMKKGVDLAVEYISKGVAHAIGEIGRPHFPVADNVMKQSNELILYCMERASDIGCPVILHTDDLGLEGYSLMEELASKAGLDLNRVVKHHALADDMTINTGIQRSVLASKSNARKVSASGKPFLLETDYVDDIKLGWKVIPPDSVPRRATMIRSEFSEWQGIFEQTFRNLPVLLFGEHMFSRFL